MRGDVGELLELGVGALELARALLERALGVGAGRVMSRDIAMPPMMRPTSSRSGTIWTQ